MLLKILRSFLDMVLKIPQIRPNNLCIKYLYVIKLKKKNNLLRTALLISPTNLGIESIKKKTFVHGSWTHYLGRIFRRCWFVN